MKISYKKLWVMLLERDISKKKFREDLKLATGTMAKLNANEEVAMSVLMRICEYMNCDIGDIVTVQYLARFNIDVSDLKVMNASVL